MKKTGFKGNENTRIWCEYCRTFVYNNRINRDKHDSSPQHQANFKKKVETLRREEEQKKRSLPSQPASTLAASFYQTTAATTTTPSSTSSSTNIVDTPANILSIKSAKKPVEAKTVLGLGTNSNVVKVVREPSKNTADDTSVEYSEHRAPPLDSKSISSELKRKMYSDERRLFEGIEHIDPEYPPDLDISAFSLFKKKKSK